MSNNLKGFWDDRNDTNKRKHPTFTKPSKAKKKKKRQRNKILYGTKDGFYSSKEWRQIRYMVIKHYGGECMACGRSKKHHGVVIHVDHIKPRSRFPDLALKFDNLQVLCEECNLGKMTQIDDWRPPAKNECEESLDDAYLISIQGVYV